MPALIGAKAECQSHGEGAEGEELQCPFASVPSKGRPPHVVIAHLLYCTLPCVSLFCHHYLTSSANTPQPQSYTTARRWYWMVIYNHFGAHQQ